MNFHLLEQYLDSLNEEYGIPALDVIVTKDHETVFRRMVGHSDFEGKRPVSGRDFYLMYSCTKLITMTAMMQLIEAGKASLYDPVSRVFIRLPELDEEVTAGESFAEVESVKAVSDVYSPVSGKVVEVNEALLDAPELVNEDPYGAWLVRIAGTRG